MQILKEGTDCVFLHPQIVFLAEFDRTLRRFEHFGPRQVIDENFENDYVVTEMRVLIGGPAGDGYLAILMDVRDELVICGPPNVDSEELKELVQFAIDASAYGYDFKSKISPGAREEFERLKQFIDAIEA